MIKVMFFAHLRDLAGAESLEISSDEITNVDDLLSQLAKDHSPELISALSDKSAMLSINMKYAPRDASIEDGDEVGFLPPVSGG